MTDLTVSEEEAAAEYRAAEEAALEDSYRAQEDEALRQALDADGLEKSTSWASIDLAGYVDGTVKIPEPAFWARTDGQCLIYRGKTHYFIGESESGKTWAALAAVKHTLELGEGVLFIDYEDEATTFVERLRAIGVSGDVIADRSRVAYIRPNEDLVTAEAKVDFVRSAQRADAALVILDGVTEAMMLAGLNIRDEGDVARFHAKMPRLWDKSGAAVVLIDHVTKSKDGRGSYAIGSQHKRAGVNGASYKFEIQSPIGRGRHGKVKVSVTKDRPGHVRKFAAGGDVVGMLHIRPTDDPELTEVVLEPIGYADLLLSSDKMEAVKEFIAAHPGCTTTAVRKGVLGDNNQVGDALAQLVAAGTVGVEVRGKGRYHTIR